MPVITVNSVRLNYRDTGSGAPVLLIMGSGSSGQAWHLHQVPDLVAAGFRVVTFENRGIAPSDICPEGFTFDDLVTDSAGLIEVLNLGPCQVVGLSMGARIAQELALARPDLVKRAVLMATRGRANALRAAFSCSELELCDSRTRLPPAYAAIVQAVQNLAPATLNDDAAVQDWLELFELSGSADADHRAQLAMEPMADRRTAYGAITVPCQVIAFADDLLAPPHLGREVADAIPGAEFAVLPGGHYGYLENPAEVNKAILRFLR